MEEELARLSEPYVVNNLKESVILFSRYSKADAKWTNRIIMASTKPEQAQARQNLSKEEGKWE